MAGHSANVLHNTERPSGLSRLVADLEKAGRLLGYAPQTELFTGLQRLMEEDPIFQHLRPGSSA
ncbi:MAG: hypothetical protein R2911_37705 [Caldilineaceae bacterium]